MNFLVTFTLARTTVNVNQQMSDYKQMGGVFDILIGCWGNLFWIVYSRSSVVPWEGSRENVFEISKNPHTLWGFDNQETFSICRIFLRSIRLKPTRVIMFSALLLMVIIIHQTHYEKSDWSRAFNQFTMPCELDMINAISAADIEFIMSSSTSAWLLSPLECSQKQNGWTLRFCFWGWIMWKMYNKTIIEFGFRISWIIKTSPFPKGDRYLQVWLYLHHFFLRSVTFPYSSLYTQAVPYTTYAVSKIELWRPVLR